MDLVALSNGKCPNMEDKNTLHELNQNGQIIYLHMVQHSDSICQEIIVRNQGFCFKRWILWTSILNIIGYILDLHLQVLRTYSIDIPAVYNLLYLLLLTCSLILISVSCSILNNTHTNF